MISKSFRPDPTIEEPQIAWGGPVKVSYWPKQSLIEFEAFGLRNGERHVVRSFTVRGLDLVRSPAVVELLRQALDDVEAMEPEASDED